MERYFETFQRIASPGIFISAIRLVLIRLELSDFVWWLLLRVIGIFWLVIFFRQPPLPISPPNLLPITGKITSPTVDEPEHALKSRIREI
jgi:hypothetical protein